MYRISVRKKQAGNNMIKIQNRAKKRPGIKEVMSTCLLCGEQISKTGNHIIYVKTKRDNEYWIHRKCFDRTITNKCKQEKR